MRHPLVRLAAVTGSAGVVLAVVLFPILGAAGLAAKTFSNSFERMPAYLATPTPSQVTRVLASDGSVIATFYTQDRVPVPLSKIAPVAQQAIVAIEDARFWEHGALDLHGILRAAIADLMAGHTSQGASTLTQQYVKNVLLEQAQTPGSYSAAQADTLSRKLREARYAVAIERRLTKQQILERYLNLVYFGDGAYGIQSAAWRYFSVPAATLNLDQAAMLAGMVQDPSGYDPLVNPQAALARRNTVLQRMASLHVISPGLAARAEAEPLGLRPGRVIDGCEGTVAPFFCAYVRDQLLADPALGRTPSQRLARLREGGLTVRTSLDPKVQRAAQLAVDTVVPPTSQIATAVDVVQPGTGQIEAMAVDRGYGSDAQEHQTQVNLATGGGLGYPAGSTFKLFTLTAAVEQHLPLSLTLYAPPHLVMNGFPACGTGAPFPPYSVSNAEAAEGGTFSMVRATWESVNTYYVQLERKVGLCAPWNLATAMGVRQGDGQPLADVPSFTLGSNSVSPLSMADAYATIAAHGRYCPVTAVVSITGPKGRPVGVDTGACRQVVPAQLADTVTSVLRGVIDGPDPYRTGVGAAIGRPAAGKTGTTDGFSAAWFDGYTPQLAAAVWVGNPAGGFAHPLVNVTVGGRFYAHVYGADLPAQVWQQTMAGALAGVPVVPFSGAAATIAPDQPFVAPPPSESSQAPPASGPAPPAGPARHHHGG
jgi:membrane peptidoglycan carboxypeptidase